MEEIYKMNVKSVSLAEPILKALAYDNVKLEKIPEKFGITEEETCESLDYLKEVGAVQFIKIVARGFAGIRGLKVTSKGLEVACEKRPLINRTQTISQQVTNSQIKNLVQSSGNSNLITQTIDNSKHYILKQMIEKDSELDSGKRKDLFNILDKFNSLKESGENASQLIKAVEGISLKYVPLFFSLL